MSKLVNGGIMSILALVIAGGGAVGCAEQAPDDENSGDEVPPSSGDEAATGELSDELIDLAKAKIATVDVSKGVERHAPCGRSGPNVENRVEEDAPLNGAANQRSGTIALTSTNCPIVGVLQPTDDARYFCWTEGNDGFTWTYLQNLRTGVRGWTRDNLLDNFGAADWAWCGF